MNCVNKSSKEFKSLASRNNVSDNALELIVHKYWREKGNENYFPSDSYVQAQLGAIPYEEIGKSVKKLWKKKYSSPHSYETFEKLQQAVIEAQRYFPNEAIIHYQNADGKFVLAIRQPVRSFYKALDEAEAKGSFEAPKMNIGVEEGKEYTLETAQSLFEKFNKDRTSKPLADKAFKIAKDLGIKIYFNNILSDGNVGTYHDNNSITFYKAYFERGTDNDKKAEVILHEVIHALTSYALSDDVTGKPKTLQDFKSDMEQLFKELQYNPMLKGEYGVRNVEDFVAELSNPIFRQKIQAIDNSRKQSFWQRIVDAFKKLLSIHSSSPYYTRMMNTLDKALNAFDVKTYMEYNSLDKAFNKNNTYYDTLSTDDLKNELHNYVNTKLANKVKSTDALNSFIDSLPKEELSSIYDEVLHNYDDTQFIVNKLRQLAKEKILSNKQKKYFTFKDGKSVKTPFAPNDQQVDALNKINDFLHSNKDVMTLSGYAGTGKTSIMEMIAEKAKQDGIGIVFTASTNKATQVLETKVGYLGFPVMTANKAFGIALEPGDKATYDANDLKTVLVENKIDGYNAAIIDEASMINQANFKILNEIASNTGLKIIYVGDPAQLSPVKDSKKSPIFTSNQGDVVTLTKVERTGDNAILEEATNIRNGGVLSGVSSFNKEGKGVAYIKPGSEERDKIIKAFIPKLSSDPDYFRVLTYSNKSVAQYNEKIRRILGYTDNVPRIGEPIIGYTNYDYNFKTKKNNFVNSGSYKVVRVGRPIEKNVSVDGQVVSITANPVTIVGIDGVEHTYEMVDIKGNEKNKKAVVPIAQALKTLWARWKSSHNRAAKAELLKEIHKVESYLFVNDDIYDDAGHTLLNKRYDFGYAMTIHKSQGSTFNHVLLDNINIAMYNEYLDRERLKEAASHVHVTVDLSDNGVSANETAKAHSNIDNAQKTSSMSLDLFGGNQDNTQTKTNEKSTDDDLSDMVDERRQLEYVGVSRASETVTIISNDIKKEGSPLHPEVTPSENVQSSTAPTKPATPTIPVLPTKNDTINIYAGTNENADLSNLTTRPFKLQIFENEEPIQFNSVEQAFQYIKFRLLARNLGFDESCNKFLLSNQKLTGEDYKNNTQRWVSPKTKALSLKSNKEFLKTEDTYESEKKLIDDQIAKILNAKSGSEAKKLGGKNGGYTIHGNSGNTFLDTIWDYGESVSEDVMSAALKASFEQNPQAAQRLLATGDAELTHKQDNGKWGTEFPKLLMEVRDELRKEHPEWRPSQPKSIASMAPKDYITPQLIEHMKSIGIDVNDRAAIEKYLKEHGTDHIQEFINKKNIDKEELAILGSTLMTNYHNKKLYGIVEHTANYEYTVNYKGEGGFDIIEYHPIESQIEDKINDREGRKISGAIDRLSSGNEVTKEEYSSSSYHVEDRKANGNNAKLDSESSQRKPNNVSSNDDSSKHQEWSEIKRDSATGRISFVNGDGRTISTAEDWTKDAGFFITSSGEVYGFVTPDGRIFLDETKINPEHPIHEHTHLWDRALMRISPRFWNKGVELMKQTSLWKTIEEDANYGVMWKAQGLSQEEMDNRIASEVHARFVGEGGDKLLEELAKKKGQEGIIAKLKDWILEAWKSLKATFSNWSEDEINKLTLKDFNHMTMRDFVNGINPNTINPVQQVLSDKSTNMQTTLSLPNFEHFVYDRAADKLEGIKVDAPWKEQYLKDLDGQFRRADSEEEEIYMSDADKQHNQKLIDKMKVILNAKDKDDYLNKEKREYKESLEAALSDYNRLNKQYSNLLNGMTEEDGSEFIDSPLGVSEIRHIAELAMDSISDVITDIQTKDGYAEELFPNLKTKDGFDFKTATRQEIIEAIGIENLLNNAKKQFDTEQNDWFLTVDNFDDASLKADFIFNNWDAVVKMGADVFAFNEGLGISRNYDEHRFKTSKETQQLSDDFNNDLDEDSLNETEGDAQEHWQVDSRTIDAMNSMSALVRQAIHECYDLDENGNVIVNKLFGIKERIDARKVTNSILRWTQGSLTLDDMVNKLSSKLKENPWLSQLVNRLQDKSGVNTDLQSQFFGVFCKHFQLYSIVTDQDGKYTCINANAHPALTEIMNGIKAKYNIGEHPLFTAGGKINRQLLGNENTVDDSNPFNLYQALAHLPEWNFKGTNKEVDLSPEKMEEYAGWLAKAMKALGYDAAPEMVSGILNRDTLGTMVEKLHFIVHDLNNAVNRVETQGKEYKPFEFKGSFNIGSAVQNFLSPVADILEDTTINAFYDSGKMYQSYVTPSFTTKLLQKFKFTSDKDFVNFLKEEYGKSEWFGKEVFDRMAKGMTMRWNVPWLAMMGKYRKEFDHRVQLNFNGHNYMRNLSDPEYALSVIAEYYSESAEQQNDPAWFRIPMESNKPSEEFIIFMSYRNKDSNIYKTEVVEDLSDMVFMEISRIQTVLRRNLSEGDKGYIKNFDDNGKKFCFFPFLNAYMENGGTILKDADGNVSEDNKTLARLLKKKIVGEEAFTANEDVQLSNLIKKVTRTYMQERADNILDMMDRKGIIQAARKIKNISDTPETLEYGKDEEVNTEKEERINAKVKSSIENFLWNDYLASKNILMIMVGDTAFYKDAEDLQKRLAELHAPGIRGNINATDYEGKKVSADGKYRTVILKDFDFFKSNIIANLNEVFDRKIAQAPEHEKAAWKALKEDILKAYSEVNVADAEGYSSMTSYRKKALMFGKWSKEAEEIYKKILAGNYTYTELKTAFQPMKPFVYTHLEKNIGVKGKDPISMMYCPFQAKNSEVLLVMADALLMHENTSRPNILRAIDNIMEDSAYDGRERDEITGELKKVGTYNGKGIDTIQFESAIKSSLQGAIDLNSFLNDKNGGEAAAYAYLKSHIYKEGTNDYDVDNYVHEASFEDYCIQQEIPEHFKNHSQAHGSQTRMIVPSDLDYYYDSNRDAEHLNDEDNVVKYEWTDDSGNKHSLNAKEFRNHYESIIADNILNSLDKLALEFHLTDSEGNSIENKKERNIALSQILVKEIDSSPRYGIDLRWACSLDENGEFNIPLGDPIQCKRIEQLVNSIIKNRVNKQEIPGGPIVQVSNFGTSRQLHIRFNDKNGNLMPTEEEFNKAKEEDSLTDEQKKYNSYKDYIKENQGGVAYFEVFAPIWSDDIANKFMDENGNIDIKAIEETNPEMLKLITYRIPTEDKYSMAPCKIVGFMPREAGDTIMLPYELTTIDGSDFDIDKRYVMRKDYRIIENKGKLHKALYSKAAKYFEEQKGAPLTHNDKKTLRDKVDTFLDIVDRADADKILTGRLDKDLKRLYQEMRNDKKIMKLCYTTAPVDKDSKQFNDNEIVNMSWAVLTNPTSADKMLNPGGFELQKKVGYMVAAYKNSANAGISWNSLHSMDVKGLKKLCYTQKDLAWFDTQMQFYKQNSAAASLIGVFAVNKIAHAVLESDDFYIDIPEICGSGFSIAGTDFGINKNRMKVDPRYDSHGNLIGKVLGSLVGASADAVKDPVLNLMNINMTTAGMLNTMVRLGLPFEDAALFLSQDIITRVIDEFNKRNLSNYVTIDDVINGFKEDIEKETGISEDSNIAYEPISKQELIDGLREGDHKASDYKVLLAFTKLKALTESMRNITFATRFNSISSAVGSLVVDNLIMEHKISNFLTKNNPSLRFIKPKDSIEGKQASTGFYSTESNDSPDDRVIDINDVWNAHPILGCFKDTVRMAHQVFEVANMPTNSMKFRTIIASLQKYGLLEKMFSDKKLLDQLSTFYQSYMLMASGLIDSKNLGYYINQFPKKFLQYQQDEKYKDNALIQAIKLNYSRQTGKPFLQIKITGMDAKEKEELGSAWVDLYKQDQKLAVALFQYSFFRAGIGFSPKTFMALVPVYVKNHLSKTLEDGTEITYKDVYKGKFNDRIVDDNVIDQFIRNNWDNNKLVPWVRPKDSQLSINYSSHIMTVSSDKGFKDLMGKMYVKTSGNGTTYLWKKEGMDWDTDYPWIYKLVSPLGNNGEYLEISTDDIKKAYSETLKPKEKDNEADADMKKNSPLNNVASDTKNPPVPDKVEEQKAVTLSEMFMNYNSHLTQERIDNLVGFYKKGNNAEKNVDTLQKIFKANGLDLNREETVKKFKELC